MVAALLDRFCRDGGEAPVGRSRQPLVELELERIDQHLANDALAEISVRLLDQRGIQELALLTQERDFVLARPAPSTSPA